MKRNSPMRRGKPMKAGKPMKRAAGLARTTRKWKPARDTGPSQAVRKLILAREGMQCAGCGISITGRPWSIQHRQARGMGGTSDPAVNLPSNLVLLCGSATSPGGCHLACEDRDPDMHGRGFWLYSWESPELTPVMLAGNSGTLVWLDDSGEYAFAPPEGMAA